VLRLRGLFLFQNFDDARHHHYALEYYHPLELAAPSDGGDGVEPYIIAVSYSHGHPLGEFRVYDALACFATLVDRACISCTDAMGSREMIPVMSRVGGSRDPCPLCCKI
jgi:hypothetical protein